jgi:hypothetical protein
MKVNQRPSTLATSEFFNRIDPFRRLAALIASHILKTKHNNLARLATMAGAA